MPTSQQKEGVYDVPKRHPVSGRVLPPVSRSSTSACLPIPRQTSQLIQVHPSGMKTTLTLQLQEALKLILLQINTHPSHWSGLSDCLPWEVCWDSVPCALYCAGVTACAVASDGLCPAPRAPRCVLLMVSWDNACLNVCGTSVRSVKHAWQRLDSWDQWKPAWPCVRLHWTHFLSCYLLTTLCMVLPLK